ncbi:hypothetical protein AB0H12_21945 [Actinosynnema sp. NPDC023794]
MPVARGCGMLAEGFPWYESPSLISSAAATGFASQNGGNTGGQGGATVRATTGTQIHQVLCGRAGSSTPIVIEVSSAINHGNTAKVSGSSCETAAGVVELKRISNVAIIGVGGGAVFDRRPAASPRATTASST